MNIIKNKGFSLIEILVAMTLIGVLSAIAVPAYNSYRKDANSTVLKADIGNAYKAMHTYNAVNSTFCVNLKGSGGAGLDALFSSQTYNKDGKKAFVGAAGVESGCTGLTAANYKLEKNTPTINRGDCKIGDTTFKIAVANEFGGAEAGFSVTNTDSAPSAGGAYCSNGSGTVYANCDQTKCGTANDACHGQTSGQTWHANGALCQ